MPVPAAIASTAAAHKAANIADPVMVIKTTAHQSPKDQRSDLGNSDFMGLAPAAEPLLAGIVVAVEGSSALVEVTAYLDGV